MGYIINKNSDLFIKSKITEKGREKLAKGKLTYASWAIGDSEINYSISDYQDSKILNISDKYPSVKYSLYSASGVTNVINEDNINVEKIQLYSQKDEIGYFDPITKNALLTIPKIKLSGTLSNSYLNGTNTISTQISAESGGILLIKLSNSPELTANSGVNLWYKIVNVTPYTTVLDRNLPNLSLLSGNFSYILYSSDEIYNIFPQERFDLSWNNDIMDFVPENENILLSGSPVWNMNIVYNENFCGYSTGWTQYSGFSSQIGYLGTKDPFLNPFNIDKATNNDLLSINCGVIKSAMDINKSAAIIHYTNNDYYNGYDEYIYIDDNNSLVLYLPTIMYHNRYFSGNTITNGMSFISDGTLKYISGTSITYYDLIENPDYIKPNATPNAIGKIFNQLELILITNDEINTSLTYLSNRNYTLPDIEAELEDSVNGLLEPTQTIYLTYELKNTKSSGFNPSLPCQNYIKVYNNSTKNKNINFWFKDSNPFIYLTQNLGLTGFTVNEFNLLYQIVDNYNDRPEYNKWNKIPIITGNTNMTATDLSTNYFSIDKDAIDNESSQFNLSTIFSPTSLMYGDEKMFYGNVSAFAGTTIFKTYFTFKIDSSKFNNTTNPTYSDDKSIKMSELNVFDAEGDLVMVGKLSKPIDVGALDNLTIKVDIDF